MRPYYAYNAIALERNVRPAFQTLVVNPHTEPQTLTKPLMIDAGP